MRRLVLLALISGCGSDGTPGQPDAPINPNQCQPGNPFDLDGTAGVLATLNVRINAGGIVVNAEVTAELLLLLDIDQSGQSLGINATLCDLKVPDVPVPAQPMPIRFVVDPTLLESVPMIAGSATLGGTTTCATVQSQPITLIIGAKLDPPVTAPLPEADANGMFTACTPAPCVEAITTNCACDQEEDGKPGATLAAQNVPVIPFTEIYVTIRTTFSLDGEVWSSDRIEGGVDATLEQGILGCTKATGPCTTGDLGLIQAFNPTIEQSQIEPSTFRTARVSSTLTCAELRAMKDTLFPP